MEAIAYQQAFIEGMRKGMEDCANEAVLTSRQKAEVVAKLNAPARLKDYVSQWQSGWTTGYGYGEHFIRRMR